MDDLLFYIRFNSISAISVRWADDNNSRLELSHLVFRAIRAPGGRHCLCM